jgi:ABC-type tungstate transport system substrate-binding protein
LFKLLSKAIPVENKDVVMTIAGVVIGQLVVIIAYYFGQSKIDNDATKYKNDHTNHNN